MPDEPRSFPPPYPSADVAAEGRVASGEIPGLASPSTIAGPDWPRAMAAIRRFRWLVAGLTLAGAAAGVVASVTIETEYRAEMTLAIDTSAVLPIAGPLRVAALLDSANWGRTLADYGVLDEVAGGSGDVEVGVERADLGVRFEAHVDRDAGLVRLSFEDGDAGRAASILNDAARRLVELELELKREMCGAVVGDLTDRIDFASDELERSGAALAETRRVIRESPADRAAEEQLRREVEGDTAVASFFDRRVVAEQVTRDREALDGILQSAAESGLQVDAVEMIAGPRGAAELLTVIEDVHAKRAELSVLRARYDDRHPRIRQLQTELAALEDREAPRLTWVLFRMLRARESEMYEELTAAPAELKATPRRLVEQERLERHIEAVVQYSQILRERRLGAEATADAAAPALRVVEVAEVPGWPTSRTRKINLILLSVLGCLCIGAAGAVVLDRLDPLVHDPLLVARELGVAILGTVPRLPLRNRQLRSLAVEEVVEVFGLIRENLSYQHGQGGSLLVAVNSFAPRDGKTLVVCNLALAFAHLGKQTVLVDAAGRRSTLHERLDCSRGPGLTEYLAGEATWEEVLQFTKYDSVDLVARGTRSPVGLKPIPEASMSGLLSLLRTVYDVVLVEGLPLSYGHGALALGRLAGNMLLVLRADATDLGALETKLDLIEPMQIRVVGAVLNRVPPH
jgi:capsular exopolysaccharide synthesis family protein